MTNQTVSTKITGRENALKLLQAQLTNGMKSTKGIRPYDGTKTDKQGKRIKLYTIPLTAEDRTRIQIQIDNLQKKILAHEDRVSGRVTVTHTGQLDTVVTAKVKSGKPMRPKNPITKLYRQIQGVYQKIIK